MLDILFIIGCMWVVYGIIMKTKNVTSSLLFKVFPIATGGFTMYFAASMLNWI